MYETTDRCISLHIVYDRREKKKKCPNEHLAYSLLFVLSAKRRIAFKIDSYLAQSKCWWRCWTLHFSAHASQSPKFSYEWNDSRAFRKFHYVHWINLHKMLALEYRSQLTMHATAIKRRCNDASLKRLIQTVCLYGSCAHWQSANPSIFCLFFFFGIHIIPCTSTYKKTA